jgi:hypothetical protein
MPSGPDGIPPRPVRTDGETSSRPDSGGGASLLAPVPATLSGASHHGRSATVDTADAVVAPDIAHQTDGGEGRDL